MKTQRKLTVVAIGMFSATLFAPEASAQVAQTAQARNVVLVHGAWADGSSWAEVIARLQAAGLKVTAVQNPLTSIADSVAATRRALALQDGPTVLVAHSWGGTNQPQLIELLARGTETSVRHSPGFISAALHRGLDGTKQPGHDRLGAAAPDEQGAGGSLPRRRWLWSRRLRTERARGVALRASRS